MVRLMAGRRGCARPAFCVPRLKRDGMADSDASAIG
jgi:hypothetical protein